MSDKSPINQAARKALLQLKLKPWPNYPIVQLLEWSIREYLERPKPGSRGEELLEMWERMLGWIPQEMMDCSREIRWTRGNRRPCWTCAARKKQCPPRT